MRNTEPPQTSPRRPPQTARRTNTQLRRNRLVFFFTAILVIGPLGNYLVWTSSRRDTGRSDASTNARMLGQALIQFYGEFGEFPCDATISKVHQKRPLHGLSLGTSSSNAYFRQLIAAGIVSSEDLFFANARKANPPDNLMVNNDALCKGECGFAYLLLPDASPDPGVPVPLAMAPAIPGENRFDEKAFRSNTVILYSDGSVRTYPISKSGQVLIHGKDIFDPSQPFWNGKPPDIKWPE